MTATQPAATSTGFHAFTAALAARDVDALAATLAPDAVLHSAVTDVPFQGQELLTDLYASLFESFEELRVTDELSKGDTLVFFWEGRMDGRFVEGADRVRLNSAGRVQDITIVGRPLTGLSAFVTKLGTNFARRRRGGLVAGLLRLATLPLPYLFRAFDPITRWLLAHR
jgi:ketosteroid isomerase-like protein